jgi:hypothetical protein
MTITLIVPVGRQGRTTRVRLPAEAARWLRDQLVRELGSPKTKRRPRIRRGRWLNERKGR